MRKKLYILSLDAFGSSDLDLVKDLPNFKALLERSALVKGVQSIYPSLTYPAHTTIATGMYPKHHGVINNTHIQSERVSPDWYWYASEIKAETFFDVAKKAGYSICSLLWPVTGRSDAIAYNLAEIFPNRPWQTQMMVSAYSSSLKYALQMNHKYGHLRKGIAQPQLDDFITEVAVDTIRNLAPDMMAIHLVDLDSTRHDFGVRSEQAVQALERMDARLGKIVAAMKEKGIYENTIFAVLGDHYQIETHTVIRVNYLFLDRGWLEVSRKGQIRRVKVYAKAADGSCYIYRYDASVSKKSILDALKGINVRIEAIYSGEEAGRMGADPNCLFMLEAKRGYYFAEDLVNPFMETTNKQLTNRKLLKASHGFHPGKNNYQTMLMLSGPGIDRSVQLEQGRLVDEGPTLLHAIGLSYEKKTDGRIMEELFEYEAEDQ